MGNIYSSDVMGIKRKIKSHRAAEILYEVVKAYHPAWYDVFGYDISGRRQRLIESFVHDTHHDKSVDRRYGRELNDICKSHARGKLLQELRFGLLVNKVFEDLKLNLKSKKLRRDIDPTVLKIAKASSHEYCEYKASAGHTPARV